MTTDPPLRIALIGSRAVRETLASWFGTIAPGCTILSFARTVGLLRGVERGETLNLVAIGSARRGPARKLLDTIGELTTRLPGMPVVVVPYRPQPTLRIADIVRHGARGCLPMSLDPAVARAELHAVLAGATIASPEALLNVARPGGDE